MKRNSLRALALLLLASSQLAFGQQVPTKQLPGHDHQIVHKSYPNEQGVIRCHTMEHDSIMREEHNMPSLYQEEMWLQQQIEKFKKQQKNSEAKAVVLTIPVVVHVIHDGDAIGSGENISDCQVQSQIQVMNEDFRRMMGTNGWNTHPDGADVEVEFCLAVVDPNGNPTDGIDRVNYGTASFTSTGAVDAMKTNTFWDPNNYMNMWTVRFGGAAGGLLGYAQFPNSSGLAGLNANNGPANEDGVVAGYQYFGSSQICPSGTYGAPYDLGRTMTHEVGHFLGLRHIWGDSNCGNDFCADTPESQSSNGGCPTQTTCDGIQDMVENYMDYTNDACMNIFTQDQKTRILTVLSVSPRRASLTTSTVCQSPDPDDAGISAVVSPQGTICGSSVDAIVTLTNYGNNDLTSVDIVWDLDGGGSTTYNWTGTLTPGSSVDVTVTTLNPSAGPHTFNVSTNNPNGTTDTNASNDANSSSFTIVIGGEMITLEINTDCWGEEIYWELLDQGTSNVVASGGNTTGVPPGGQQIGTAQSDPGAYPNQTLVQEQLCVASACYDFVIYDDWGDGLEGTASGCAVDGDWQILDGSANVVATMSAVNYGNSDNATFCLQPPCNSTFSDSQTVTENCFGDDTGEITVTQLTGNTTGTTYDIGSGPQASGVFTGLAQGSYTVTIIDGDACASSVNVTVSGPAALNATISVNDISCNGQVDGQVIVTTTGGTPNITYDIGSGPVGSGTFTGLSQGSYTVDVADANGCTTTVNGTVTEPAVLTASTGTITPEYFGNDGSVDLIVGGGSPNYTYSWTGPNGYTSSQQDPSNMAGGTYSVTVTDASGCTVTINNIVVPSELGVDEFGNVQFVIYPNPSNGQFNVQLIDNAEEIQMITVTDVAGRVVYSLNDISGNTFMVDLASAANGTYMMNIETETTMFTKRIVLKK